MIPVDAGQMPMIVPTAQLLSMMDDLATSNSKSSFKGVSILLNYKDLKRALSELDMSLAPPPQK